MSGRRKGTGKFEFLNSNVGDTPVTCHALDISIRIPGLVSVRTSPLADARKELLYTAGRQNLQKASWRAGISHGSDPHWIHTPESVAHVARVSWQRVQRRTIGSRTGAGLGPRFSISRRIVSIVPQYNRLGLISFPIIFPGSQLQKA